MRGKSTPELRVDSKVKSHINRLEFRLTRFAVANR
jgi:hypothetical protein